MASKPIDTCSPVEAITSSSRWLGSGWSSFARASRRLVSPAMAEGTTTSWWPSRAKRATRRATSRMRSGLPMEVPPYFWTINDTLALFRGPGKSSYSSPTRPPPGMTNPLRPQSVALIALAIGVAATLAGWYVVGRQAEAEARAELASQAAVATNVVERRIQRYIDLLYGLDALANHEPSLSRLEFHTFVSALDLGLRLPGVQAVEYLRRVRDRDRDAFVASVRNDRTLTIKGYPEFNIRPPGRRDEYWVIDYVEPLAGNESAFGLDVRARRGADQAAERSRDTGSPIFTGK